MEIARITRPVRMVRRDLQRRDHPHLAAQFDPAARERLVLAVPDMPMRAVVEQVNMRVAVVAVTKLRKMPDEAIDSIPRDLQEPGRNRMRLDASIRTHLRVSLHIRQQRPHVFLGFALESVRSGNHIAFGVQQPYKVFWRER